MITRKSFSDIAEIILEGGAVKATKYFSPKSVIKGTRRMYGNKKGNEILFTFGKPNYAERKFIKDCIKSGEKFPIRKIQIKY